MGKTCVICGKPTGTFVFCREHQAEKEKGLIVKCNDCGTWHYADTVCTNCGGGDILTHNTTEEENSNVSNLTCIICGEPSNGKHFCKACYFKYKDRSVDLRITHCTDTEILDEYGNLTYKCNDGRKVRSRAEKIISDELFNLKVLSVYEETVNYYTNQGEIIELHPDFYLPQYDMYIEYNELKNKPYLKNKEQTQRMYKELNKQVIIMSEKDLEDVKKYLKQLLKIS